MLNASQFVTGIFVEGRRIMKKGLRHFAQKYVEWVVRLGKVKFSLLGVTVLAIFALCTQIIVSLCIVGTIYWTDIVRSVTFGLISAPFAIYFFTLLVEKLERSRLELAKIVDHLRREVSERIIAEKKLSVALGDLEQNNRDKTALMMTISHELKTPLNGIIGLSQILLDEQLTEQQRNYLKTINMSAIALGHIFGDIIDLQKIDAQNIELNPQETNLQDFINDIANFAGLMAEQKQLKFEIHVDRALSDWLMLDSVRLSQILWNLINNAVKFTEKGKITLSIEQQKKDMVRFTLTDTGVGIPLDELDNIFTMYYQVQSNPQRPLGSGIGLAVSKTLAQLMGGDLIAKSEYGTGASFILTIKAEEVEKPLLKVKKVPDKLRILLVEDIEVNVIVAKSVLEKLGYTVDVAMTGQEAIEKFECNYYDLLLLDIQLPDMSGFDVANHLRNNYSNDKYEFLPLLIALTANVIHSKEEYRQKGMDDVLRKPLSLDELTYCLLNYFSDELEPVVSINHSEQNQPESHILDLKLLDDLVQLLGTEFVKKNLELFKSSMAAYIKELGVTYSNYIKTPSEKTALISVAHKIKGAMATMGLKRLQQIADNIQSPELNNWEQELANWVQLLEREWLLDVAELEARLQ